MTIQSLALSKTRPRDAQERRGAAREQPHSDREARRIEGYEGIWKGAVANGCFERCRMPILMWSRPKSVHAQLAGEGANMDP